MVDQTVVMTMANIAQLGGDSYYCPAARRAREVVDQAENRVVEPLIHRYADRGTETSAACLKALRNSVRPGDRLVDQERQTERHDHRQRRVKATNSRVLRSDFRNRPSSAIDVVRGGR